MNKDLANQLLALLNNIEIKGVENIKRAALMAQLIEDESNKEEKNGNTDTE